MIIKSPTGFYKTVLPSTEEDTTSVTYTISNTDPPRTELTYPKIPRGVTNSTLQLDDPRENFGELLFTISSSSKSQLNNNARQYVLGQILDFVEPVEKSVDPMLVGDTELRHDFNIIDWSSLGLDSADQVAVDQSTSAKFESIISELNIARTGRADSESIIADTQKTINELNRAITALEIIDDASIASVLSKLQAKLAVVQDQQSAAIESANLYAAQAAQLSSDLQAVSNLMR